MDSISTDTDSGAAIAYSYSDKYESLTVESHVVVSSQTYVIESSFALGILVNKGELLSGSWAVYFTSVGNNLTNTEGSRIIGADRGMSFEQDQNVITNDGTIFGLKGQGIFLNAGCADNIVYNHGFIYGREAGVRDYGYGATNTLVNTGTIQSAKYAVTSDMHLGEFIIFNRLAGVLKGDVAAVYTDQGTIDLTNRGTLLGGILCTGAEPAINHDDEVRNMGKIVGTVKLSLGNDIFDGRGGTSGKVFGQEGVDRLTGGPKGDRFSGGLGNDIMNGGGGPDRFFFDSAIGPVANFDRINGFLPTVDKLVLDDDIFLGIGPVGTLAASRFHATGDGPATPADRIFYNSANGWLTYDANGSNPGGDGPIHFATLARNLPLTHGDILVAT